VSAHDLFLLFIVPGANSQLFVRTRNQIEKTISIQSLVPNGIDPYLDYVVF